MEFEREVWQAFITNNSGDVQPNAQITVFDAGTNNLSTIYSGLTGAPRPNPFNTGSDGLAKFYAEPARYRVQAQTPAGIAVFDDVDLSQKALREDLSNPGGARLVLLEDGKNLQEYSEQFSDEALQQAITDAQAEADRAETAAEQAAAAGLVYESSAEGQADVNLANGDYFWVVSASDTEVLELWRKGASSPTDTGKRTASADAIWSRTNLSDRFDFVGEIASGDLIATATKTGVYLAVNPADHSDAPPNASETLLIQVSTAYSSSGDWVHQTAREWGNPQNCWIRRVRISVGSATNWEPVSGKDVIIGTNDIAEKAVTRSVLADAFLFNGTLETGEPLSTAMKDGYYIVASGADHPDAPSTGVLSLEVVRVYGAPRWLHQTVREFANPSNAWARRVDTQSGTAQDWRAISGSSLRIGGPQINNESITYPKLHASFTNAGVLSGESLNQALKPGVYLTQADVIDAPEAMSGVVGILEVWGRGDAGHTVQRIINNNNSNERWSRRCRPDNDDYGQWSFDGFIPAQKDRFAGKTIIFFGDSITGSHRLAQNVNLALTNSTIKNFGLGGTRIAVHPIPNYADLSGWALATAINTGDWASAIAAADAVSGTLGYAPERIQEASQQDWNEVDYIVVGYGTNDFDGTPIGTIDSNTPNEFCGGVNIFIDQILAAYPHIKMLFWTPLWRARTPTHTEGIDGGSDVSPNSNGEFLYEFGDALIEICRKKKQPVIDLYRTSGIFQPTNTQYLVDGVHPTLAGRDLLAGKIVAGLQSNF